jgi:hypothetical protein
MKGLPFESSYNIIFAVQFSYGKGRADVAPFPKRIHLGKKVWYSGSLPVMSLVSRN